jgi:hypothetical protein
MPSSPVRRPARQRTSTAPPGVESAPYLAALVANSCSSMAKGCAAAGASGTGGPSSEMVARGAVPEPWRAAA